MAVASAPIPKSKYQTVQDLVQRLGNIPLDRIRLDPPPGHATEKDVAEIRDREKRLYELVDGTLVEKAMGYRESVLAMFIVEALNAFVRPRNLGLVTRASASYGLSIRRHARRRFTRPRNRQPCCGRRRHLMGGRSFRASL